ncbi:hypothetical protein BC939DRAFT_235524 [Gamsiella multidivaricata]|uniref:uncharacterized protein n=1 Tax=Gamsiella multidivaricata TaxID=101098 RepID=UPI0022208FDE|nr:uncharacterized protein BC939DRAFT_235524 [Gamsiella multidivaricata]KAI7820469.1 hypothetical protein BC939DRAFT_235524 [Gamsiella multidivaricata]
MRGQAPFLFLSLSVSISHPLLTRSLLILFPYAFFTYYSFLSHCFYLRSCCRRVKGALLRSCVVA